MKFRIAAIGEILFDVYPNYKKLGGAPFNFIYHIWKLTGIGNLISKIGNDTNGEEIEKHLSERNFDLRFIQRDNEHKTGEVIVKLDNNKVPEFDIIKDRAYDFIELNDEQYSLVKDCDLFYFGSLAQRNEISRNTIGALTKKSLCCFCDLNIRQNYFTTSIIEESLKNSNALKLNEDELRIVCELLLDDNYDLKKSALSVVSKYNLDLLCITLGSDGSYLFDGENESHHKSEPNRIVDTVGAGDAFAAIMCIGYLNKWKLEKTNKLASEFAAEICGINGAIPDNDLIYSNFSEKINDE